MKVALIVLLFAAPALAQSLFAALPGACGPANVSFNVKLDDTQHTPPLPEPRKAQAYFIQDKGVYPFGIGGTVESTIGIDGAWVGQNKNNSYFSAPVEPGSITCARACTPMSGVPRNSRISQQRQEKPITSARESFPLLTACICFSARSIATRANT